jgi:hypothetical protein
MPENLTDTQALCIGNLDGKALWITTEGHNVCPDLECAHEEADIRIFVHCGHCSKSNTGRKKRAIIFCSDTDMAVLCCHHFASLSLDELWFHSPPKQKHLHPIHETVTDLGPTICGLLPALHALSGCDSTSSLFGIGKKKAMQALKSNLEPLANLTDLGSHALDVEEGCMEASKLVIGVFYGENTSDLNGLHYKLFTKKSFDSTKLPPTEDAAIQHIK